MRLYFMLRIMLLSVDRMCLDEDGQAHQQQTGRRWSCLFLCAGFTLGIDEGATLAHAARPAEVGRKRKGLALPLGCPIVLTKARVTALLGVRV